MLLQERRQPLTTGGGGGGLICEKHSIRSNTGGGLGGAVSPPAGPGQSPGGVQGANPLEALKSLQSTLPEAVKKSTLVGHFFLCIASQSHRKKSLKFRTKSKHFQTNVGRLHSFIKVIKFYYKTAVIISK